MISSRPTHLELLNPDQLMLDNPFWRFSLEQWQKPALQAQLLSLQNEQGLRINIVLLAMWLSFEQRDIRAQIDTLIADSQCWHEDVVIPLRHTRQSLPSSVSDLKKQVQHCELQAEQIEQAILYTSCLKCFADHSADIHQRQFDALDWLILNLPASGLGQSDLSLLIQNCLPSYPPSRIDERITLHLQAS
jgi:uncharacterized protein (TIGR02444 family)